MKFTVPRETLQQAVEIIAPAIATRDWTPICQTVQIIAGRDLVNFGASDGHLSIRASVPAQRVDEMGGICVPGKAFVAVCKESLRSEFIHFALNGIKATVNSDRASWTSKTQKSELFPEFPEWTETYDFGRHLVEGLRKVVLSIGKTELAGVQLQGNNKNRFTVLTANQETISRVTGIPGGPEEVLSLLIPDALVQQLLRLKPSTFCLHSNEKQIGADFEIDGVSVQLAHTKPTGKFPDLTAVFKHLEGKPKASISLPTQDLTYVCRVASCISENSQGDPTLTITFNVHEQVAEIETSAGDIHTYRETIPFEGTLPSDLTIEARPDTLAKFLGVIDEDSFHLEVLDNERQIRLWSTEGHDYLYSPYQVRFYKSPANNLSARKPLRVSRAGNHKTGTYKGGTKSARLKTA